MGSSGSTNQQSNQQSISQTQLPPWINQAAQQNYALAQNVANRPLTQYAGQQVADIGPQTQQAWNLAATSGGAGADQYNAAQAGYLNTLGSPITAAQSALAAPVKAATVGNTAQSALSQAALAPNTVAQQAALSQLSGTNLQPYMDPYTQSVINNTLPIMQQQLGLQQNQQQNAANSANAYGGSRQAIQQGVTQAQGALNMAQMAAQLNQANFQQAQAAGEFDVGAANQSSQFNAQQANQVAMNNQNLTDQMNQWNAGAANNMGQFNAGALNTTGQFNANALNNMGQFNASAANNMGQFNATAQNTIAGQNQNAALQAAAGLGNLGNQAQTNQRQQFLEESTAGAQQQQQAQNQIAAQQNQFNQANNYPLQQLGILQSGLTTTPYGSTTMGSSTGQQQTTTTPSLMSDVTGGLQALGSLTGAGGILNGPLTSALNQSDRHLKTDITQTGVHQPTGLPMYAYRYKGDPKSYPKVVGPMAEDAMQVAPHAVHTVGVHQPTGQAIHGVNMAALNQAGPPMGANDNGPSIRPRRMPGAGGGFSTRVPGALAPASPMGPMGAMGASMRPPKMRQSAMGMPKIAGAMGGRRG